MAGGLLALGLSVVPAFAAGESTPVDPGPALELPAPCPVAERGPCAITLQGPGAPALSPECTTEAWSARLRFPQPGRGSDSDGDGQLETVVEIRLDPVRDCGCAQFRVFLGDETSGWIFHLGNSPTNDGYGGDMGTTPHAAEVYLRDRTLSVYSSALEPTMRVERILEVDLPQLPGKVLGVEVCDQALEVELGSARGDLDPLRWTLETHSSKQLFHLGPDDADGAGGSGSSGSSIYAAFNRVVHRVAGPVSHGRVGKGARRVEITLSP